MWTFSVNMSFEKHEYKGTEAKRSRHLNQKD